MKARLAIVTTHPIQYNAPVFRMLAQRGVIEIKVFYTWGETVLKDKFDPGFNKVITWDIPLLDGYAYEMVKNISKQPGSHHHHGIVNPTIIDDIKQWNADAVMVFGWNFHSHLRVMKYFKGKIPVFFRGDSTLLDDNKIHPLKSFIKYFALRRIYKSIDVAFFVGNENRKYFEKCGLHIDQLVFSPHAIDNQRFAKKQDIDFRKKIGCNDSDKIILFAGKFEEKKNPMLLIKAFLSVKANHAHLWFVGNGPMEQELKSVVATLSKDVQSRIHFMDFQNQQSMPDVYQSCDIFVLPSQGPGETWGLAINEAMAAGKAVIASDQCGGAADLIEEGVNGCIFKSGDALMLTGKIMELTSVSSDLKQMGMVSSQKIKQFSFEKICESFEMKTINALQS